MRLKILGGTTSNQGPSLCLTCRSATIVRGAKLDDEVVACSRLSGHDARLTFSVTSCSGYSDRRLPSLYDMEDIAWILRSDPKKNEVGFKPRDAKGAARFVLAGDDGD